MTTSQVKVIIEYDTFTDMVKVELSEVSCNNNDNDINNLEDLLRDKLVIKDEYYKTSDFINKIIKIQAFIRMKYWYLPYIKVINNKITRIYDRKTKEYIHEPTIFGDNSTKNIEMLDIAFKIRQKQMKEGELAQILIGNWYGWEDLGIGHSSGLDCRKKDNTIIMDVKNKYNTCNSGSQKALLDKLSKYKKENPLTRCIWAIVNPKPNCNKLYEKIIHNGVEIEKIQGMDLFTLVFSIGNTDYSTQIITIVKHYLNNY